MEIKKKYRKSLILILILTMLLSTHVFAGSNGDYEITYGLEVNGNITEGDTILYKVTAKNINGSADDYTNVKVYVSGAFSLASGSSFLIGDINNGATSTEKSIPLVYSGTGNKINVLIDDGAGHSIVETITVANVVQTSTTIPTPVDKDRLYPEFNVMLKSDVPSFYAGQTQTFEFELENKSTNFGKNVSVEFLNDSADFPFDDSINSIITEAVTLNQKEKKTFSLDIKTNANVPSGFYTIPVKISFQNVYGIDNSIEKSIQVEVISREKTPTFIIESITKASEQIVPGTTNTIQFNLKNLGTLDAKNMRVTLEGLDINGITLNGDTPQKTITKFAAGDTDFLYYKISISDDLKVSKKELSLKLTYFDEFGDLYNTVLPVYLDIEQTSTSLYDFDVNVTSLPSQVTQGQEFKVKFDLINNSGVHQSDLKLGIKSDGGFIFKSQPLIIVKDIEPSEKQSYEFTLIADQNMTTNNYPTYITLATEGSTESINTYLGIYVDGESNANSKPKIIVDQYDFGKQTILAGDTFDLAITFFNTSSSVGIQNAKVSISSDEGAFVPVNAASSFYIESIGIKEKVTHTITMKAKSDLVVKTYNVVADIEYEDSNGNSYDKNNNPYKANESMAIPVMQELRLEVEEITVQPFGFLYQPIELYAEFFNMGKSTLANMMVKTEGDFEIQDGKYFVGNFNPGTNDYYSCTLIPTIVGTNSGKVIFEFEDALGEMHSIEKEFTIEAQEMQQDFENMPGSGDDGFPMDFEEPEKEKKSILKFVIIGIVALIFVVIIIVVIRKIKKKKELLFDE